MQELIFVTQEALYLTLVASAPAVIISLVVGFAVAVFQATTQINEGSLTFAPKLVATFLILALTGSWMGAQFYRFTFRVFDRFPALIKK
jgi:flagellar biosynthesis protein FliQ